MSWIFGVIGNQNFNLEPFLKNHGLLFSFSSGKLSVFSGGLKENIFCKKTEETSGWIVCGIGIEKYREGYRFTNPGSWESYIAELSEKDNSIEFNGHYAGIKWKNGEIIFFNDKLGIRDFFFLKEKNFTAFSTRPDFFTALNHKFELDLNELSGYWMLTFPLTINSIFKNIERLGPAGKYFFSETGYRKKNAENNFEFKDDLRTEEYITRLKKITSFPMFQGGKISLGLTGGMDSRVLLELMLKSDSKNWQTHFFGARELPDVITAKKISLDKKIQFRYFQEEKLNPDKSLKLLKEYISQLGPTGIASAVLFYPFYKSLYDQEFIIIDGGHGEIHRRESLNRILFLARNALLNKDNVKLYAKFSRNRADIFNHQVLKLMENEALQHISNLLNKMPNPENIDAENWIDMLMIKFSLPNFTGPSQTLLDSMAVAYMPYIQYSVLKDSFHLSPEKKRNGKIFRDLLRKSEYKLNRYSLVKNSIYYPFYAGSLSKRLILVAKRKLGAYYKENAGEQLLYIMKDYILDTINSADFKHFDYYDHSRIIKMVNSFYNGNQSTATWINWWLTFDLWRSIYFKK